MKPASGRVEYLVSAMRISLGPDSTTPGARTHVLAFVRALREIGMSVRVICASDAPGMGRFTRVTQSDYAGINPRRVWITDAVRLGVFLWTGIVLWCKTVVRPAPALIYERAAVLQNQTMFHARRRRALTVVEVNGILHRETAQERGMLKLVRLARFMERRLIERADLVVAVSQVLKDEILGFCTVPPERVLVVPNGVEREIYALAPDADEDDVTIGFIGSLSSWQRIDRVLAAVAAHRDEFVALVAPRRLRLEIVGDGAQYASLVELATELGISDLVTFTGRLPHDAAIARAATWSLGLAGHERTASTAMYHSPLKLYEYAALGLGIVCTDSADARELARTGVHCHIYGEGQTLADALRAAISVPPATLDERQRLREAVFADHSWVRRTRSVLEAVGASARPITVQLSLAPPDGTTRFVNQVVDRLPDHVCVRYFSWSSALFGRYDVFHVHWPEFLIHGPGWRGAVKRTLYRALLLRLRRTGTPVVRTLHNIEPHEGASAAERRLLRRTDSVTSDFVCINPVTVPPTVAGARTHVILHGHYKDRFAAYPSADPRENTMLFFGMIRPYKGIDSLLESFRGIDDRWRLRVVGAPVDAALVATVSTAAQSSGRITTDLRFVPDPDLVREVTAAEVVVLPYTDLHNSGAALVALSLGRPVVVPETPTTRALSDEVGEHWVICFSGTLTAEKLSAALATMRMRQQADTHPPRLDSRDWDTVGRRHAEVYEQAVTAGRAALTSPDVPARRERTLPR